MTPVGVFFICQNEDKCHFVNSTNLSRSTKKRLGDTKPHRRMKFYIHLCTAKFHIHNQTVPEGELCFF